MYLFRRLLTLISRTMKKRTQLNITPAIEAMAESYGAYFDKEARAWFVDGEVPGPLEALVVKDERKRDYFSQKVPQCPQCGSQMVLRSNRTTGAAFWGCAAMPCRGSRPYEDEDTASAGRAPGLMAQEQGAPKFEDKAMAARVIARAIELFRSEDSATKWLEAPKVGLRKYGGTPLEAIKTVMGCAITDRLLDERFEQQ